MVELADLLYDPDYSSVREAFFHLYAVQKKLDGLRMVFLTRSHGSPGLVRVDGSPLVARRFFQHSSEDLEEELIDIWATLMSGKDDAREARSSFLASSLKSLVRPYWNVLENARMKAAAGSEGEDKPNQETPIMEEAYNLVKAEILATFAYGSIKVLDGAGIDYEQFGYLITGYDSLQTQNVRH